MFIGAAIWFSTPLDWSWLFSVFPPQENNKIAHAAVSDACNLFMFQIS
jgi:hypothetical protein